MFSEFLTVLRTSFVDQSRDRRSLMAAFAYALVGPVLIVMMFNLLAKQLDRDTPVKLAVAGAERAPMLVQELQRRQIEVVRRPALADEAPPSLDGVDALLSVPADYADDYAAGRPGELTLYSDARRQSSEVALQRVANHLQEYFSEVTRARTMAHGVAAETTVPARIRRANVASAGTGTMMAANMLLYFFLLAPFITSMSPAIDLTAGERERQSLKPLLAQPADPLSLILGKWGVAAGFGVLGTAITVALGMALLRFAPLDELGMSIPLGLGAQAAMVLLLLPLALAVSALQVLVALLAKSFKEGQTYIQYLAFAPVIVFVLGSFSGEESEGVARYAPLTGHADVLRRFIVEGRIDWSQTALVSLVCLAVAAAALLYAQRRLTRESILSAA